MSRPDPSEDARPGSEPARRLTSAESEHQMALADGALGAAGHRVDDPEARAILRRQASGEITGAEARSLLLTDALTR